LIDRNSIVICRSKKKLVRSIGFCISSALMLSVPLQLPEPLSC
jgi:hypothetical protein